jgi:hypothetical protein
MNRQILPYTTSTAGAASVTGKFVTGKLFAILYAPGDTDTGATVTVTCEGEGSKALLTKATAGTANVWFYPRDLQHGVADGAALTGTAGGDRALPILDGAPKVVIASGGATKTGKVIVYFEQ